MPEPRQEKTMDATMFRAWVAIGKVRADAALTSLAPAEPVPSTEKVPEGTS